MFEISVFFVNYCPPGHELDVKILLHSNDRGDLKYYFVNISVIYSDIKLI